MKVIEVKNLSYTYPDGTVAVKNVSFDIDNQTTVGIIGPNGAGKTTLFLCLCGVIDFVGEIKIFGQILNKKNSKEIRKKIGVVFQNPDEQLFMPTVFEDISYSLVQLGLSEEKIKESVKESLSLVNLSGIEEKMPYHLSLGEKKRVSLSVALVMKPEILLLDEPTSELDPASKRELKEIVKSLTCTKLIFSHDIDFVEQLCDKVIIIDKGEKIVEGLTEDLLSNSSLLLSHRLM